MGRRYDCFKAYDIRGSVPDQLDADLAYRVGRAFADETGAKQVVVGHDIRLSGPELSEAFSRGVTDAGADIIDIGLCGTEMVYFAVPHLEADGGVMITASHNPPGDNGMKLVREGSRPISSNSGLNEIEERAFQAKWERSGKGSVEEIDAYPAFIDHLLTFADSSNLPNIKVLADPGNGAAGVALEKLAIHLPCTIETLRAEPDGQFPHGVPNPILPESRAMTEERLKQGGFGLGVAWDGDYDRCFFLDGAGRFIEGYYIVGVLAEAALRENPGAAIVYDPRLIWNTEEIIAKHGGRPVMSRSGHAFIKEVMRRENAEYGGEMSAHHYFRRHWFADSGMIPLLLILRLIAERGESLAEMVGDMMDRFPCSGEINSRVPDAKAAMERVEREFSGGEISRLDGLSIDFEDWRMNLRPSNTEPLLRLNVETRADADLLQAKTERVLEIVRAEG